MIRNALTTGIERLNAWADLLDSINVFPVADADTGRNLVVSLFPLRHMNGSPRETVHRLLRAARGNSGNIASRFFSGFLSMTCVADLPQAAREGRDAAWAAVAEPRHGTMLSVFDALVESLGTHPPGTGACNGLVRDLEDAVRQTPERLPELQKAGVVDAGALGMFIFLEGFFGRLFDTDQRFTPITERFKGYLRLSSDFSPPDAAGDHCISALIHVEAEGADPAAALSGWGESLVTAPEREYLKIHLHAPDPSAVREKISTLGNIMEWADEDIAHGAVSGAFRESGAVHLMTDAAGSITRADAKDLGITLLDSYILMEEQALPETHLSPSELYRAMSGGVRVSTAQASVFERRQHYQSALDRHPRVLYLCVGSIYTGNYDAAMAWKAEHDPGGNFTVMDTGAASGRLAAAVLVTARFNRQARDPEAVIRFAQTAVDHCEEYVFLDCLRYLAAGGRLSRTSAFFGDMLHLKPVVSPTAMGAQKVGVVRDREAQLAFALEKLGRIGEKGALMLILLEYSDNREWVETLVQAEMKRQCPEAEIVVRPLSLTSGVHMGPGTWAAAFLPKIQFPQR